MSDNFVEWYFYVLKKEKLLLVLKPEERFTYIKIKK